MPCFWMLVVVGRTAGCGAATAATISARADNSSGLNFSVFDPQGREILQSQPLALAFYVENRWHRLGDGLRLGLQRSTTGTHPILGEFSGHESVWMAGTTEVVCVAQAYPRAVIFSQRFPHGASGTNVTAQNCYGGSEGDSGCDSEPNGYFPAINPKAGLLPNLTYFGLSGNMNEYHQRGVGLVAPWGGLPSTGGYKPNGPTDSGPFIVFEEDSAGVHMVISPMNNYMVFSQALSSRLSGGGGGGSGGSSSKSSGGSTCVAAVQQNADLNGHDILVNGKLGAASNSSDDCCLLCNQTAGCVAWTWIGPHGDGGAPFHNRCYPKSVHGTASKRSGHFSGCVSGQPCIAPPSPTPQPPPPSPVPGGLTYVAGVHYEVDSVPPGFNHSTMLWFGAKGDGVTATVLSWGKTMQALHGVNGKAPSLKNDITTSKLGAWTDAGTYYYRPAKGTNMQTILASWVQTLRNATPPIPVHYLQLDDWFYKTDETDIRCMTNFSPAVLLPDGGHAQAERGYFEGGLKTVADAVGLPLHLYHACFDATTGYAKANGGSWDFDVSPGNRDGTAARFAQVSAADSYSFYSMLWKTARLQSGGQFVGSEVSRLSSAVATTAPARIT